MNREETIIHRNGAILEKETPNFYFFTIINYFYEKFSVVIHKLDDRHSCSCEFSSMWGSGEEKYCYHIKAGLLFLEKHKENKKCQKKIIKKKSKKILKKRKKKVKSQQVQ